jgi:hypothetical protein
VGSIVANPTVETSNPVLGAIVNHNQVALILQFNSGLPFTITGNRDLNQDGSGSDRPLYIGRNSMYLPARWNTDVRYSRFFPIPKDMRMELIAEFKNIFNTVQVSGVQSSVQVDAQGNPVAPIPTAVRAYGMTQGFEPSGGYEQREFQLGLKLYFR